MNCKRQCTSTCIAMLAGLSVAHASPGDFDNSFGDGGIASFPAVSPSGALIVLTMRPTLGLPVFGVAALQPNGQRDPAFEQRALDALNCGPQFAAGSNPVGVTRWNGGKLLVAMGVAASQDLSAPRTLCVSRLNEDGSLDTSFATNGHLIYQNASLINHSRSRYSLEAMGGS